MSKALDILKQIKRRQKTENFWKTCKGNPDSEYAKVLDKQENYTPYAYCEDEQTKFEWIISECQEQAERRIPRNLYREDWYDFSRRFVSHLGESKVNAITGMSNVEYKDYLIDSNNLFGRLRPDPNATNTNSKLKEFLNSLGDDGPEPADNNYDEIFE